MTRSRFRIPIVAVALITLAACAERPVGSGTGSGGTQGGSSPDEPVTYESNGFVLDDGSGSVLCLGGVNDSLPPRCDGIPLSGWDWDAVEGEDAAQGARWGAFTVTGTYDGTRFTVIDAGPPQPYPDRGPIGTPCAEPDGGWASPEASPDLSRATRDDMLATMHAAEDEPAFSGFWVDYVVEPVGEEVGEPGGVVANVAFTGDVERHVTQIRETWGGPLCVVEFERTYHELRRIQDGFAADIGDESGLQTTWSSGDVTRNRVEIGVVVATEEARRAVDERYGEGAVLLVPALMPVG
ncbi:MAG: hypothetical protein WD834_01580 [Actinomycetota bacterium]